MKSPRSSHPCNSGGTWPDTNVVGSRLFVTIASGSTLTAPVADSWQSGNFSATLGISNDLATVGHSFELFDVRLYPDPNNSGIAAVWIASKFDDVLRECQRYFSVRTSIVLAPSTGNMTTALKVKMRVSPTASNSTANAGFGNGAITADDADVFASTRGYDTVVFNARM